MKNIKLIVLTFCTTFSLVIGANSWAGDLVQKETLQLDIIDIENSILKMPLDKGVSVEDARMSINLKAGDINMANVGYLPVSDSLKKRGIKTQHLEIFLFCNPEDAMKMVNFNTLYAAFMPCRISLVEDNKGRLWLQMLNLDMIINKYPLPEDLRRIAVTINAQMLAIITAGVKGSF